jgi:hypothetical protein
MRTIWKFELHLADSQVLRVPEAFDPLSVQLQGDALVLWAMVNDECPIVLKRIGLVGTGGDIGSMRPGEYVGTVQLNDPPGIVLHVFVSDVMPRP